MENMGPISEHYLDDVIKIPRERIKSPDWNVLIDVSQKIEFKPQGALLHYHTCRFSYTDRANDELPYVKEAHRSQQTYPV
jgi:hypothetical protein